jgi:predicted dehydrogenase
MLLDSNLDAIVISTPDDLHYEMTMCALDAGLHVLCEKPLAKKAEHAWKMFQKAEKTGVKHMTYFTYRWLPFYQYTRNLIEQGYIGRCYHCEFRMPMGFGRSQEYGWRFDQYRSNGVLGDLGSHMIDMARWLIGDITSVSAQLAVSINRNGLDGEALYLASDTVLLLVRFADGGIGTIQVSYVAHIADRGGYQQIKLYGEDGTLKINYIYRGSEAQMLIRGARSQDKQFQTLQVPDSFWGDANSSEIITLFTQNSVGTRLFIDAIMEDHPVEPNFYDGFKAQQVVDAALESHQKRCEVSIDNSL